MKDVNVFEQDFEEMDEARKNPLADEIEESFNGDVITAIKHFLNEGRIDDTKTLFNLLANEAFDILSGDDYVALCENVLDDLDEDYE